MRTGTNELAPYAPATTPVLSMLIVPEVVIGPPIRPVPVATDVTVEGGGNEVHDGSLDGP
jgi:hypothetical protein